MIGAALLTALVIVLLIGVGRMALGRVFSRWEQ